MVRRHFLFGTRFRRPWSVRLVVDFSRPWGCTLSGGRFVRFAWCWGQAESRFGFMGFRLLVVGPVGVSIGRITRIAPEA